MSKITLLGPQRFRQTIGPVLKEAGLTGPVATVTAGWEEREDELQELDHYVQLPAKNLELFARAERLVREDPDLLATVRERRDLLREAQALYDLRLSHTLAAARELIARNDDSELLAVETAAAIEAVRALDAEHVRRTQTLAAAFDAEHGMEYRDDIRIERAAIHTLLEDLQALVITGGNVEVILGHLWLFDVLDALGDKPIIAWSAGAMALTDRVVLFHDAPPQGAGNAEVLARGLGICPGIVPLPHAQKRLRLDDPRRVSLFARRFAPAVAITLEEGGRLDWDGEGWTSSSENRRLTVSGVVEPMPPEFEIGGSGT